MKHRAVPLRQLNLM